MPLDNNVLLYGLAPKLTEEQKEFVDSIMDYSIVFCDSKAGTGKTTLAVAMARYLVELGNYDNAVYIFNPTEERSMGYRPGSQKEKELVYTQPLIDALVEIGQQPEKALKTADYKYGWVEPVSHVFMRGVNFQKKVIIIDEAQNFSAKDLKKVLTRIHDSCKVIVIGHTGQVDTDTDEESGFALYLEHFKDEEYCKVVTLTTNFRGRIARHADLLEV